MKTPSRVPVVRNVSPRQLGDFESYGQILHGFTAYSREGDAWMPGDYVEWQSVARYMGIEEHFTNLDALGASVMAQVQELAEVSARLGVNWAYLLGLLLPELGFIGRREFEVIVAVVGDRMTLMCGLESRDTRGFDHASLLQVWDQIYVAEEPELVGRSGGFKCMSPKHAAWSLVGGCRDDLISISERTGSDFAWVSSNEILEIVPPAHSIIHKRPLRRAESPQAVPPEVYDRWLARAKELRKSLSGMHRE